MTDKRISPLQWLSTKFASLNHSHSEYLTSHQDITGKEDKSNKSSSISTDTGSTSKYTTVKAVEDYAQPKGNYLTQHQSLKTINNESLIGTGNISISGGSGTVDSTWVTNSTNPVQSQLIKTALDGKANSSHTHNTTEIRDSSAYSRIGSDINDTQANINDSIDLALAGIDDNILYTKMELVGFQEFQVKDFINPNNWENSGCTYSDGVLTFSRSNSFTATFPTDSLVGELAYFELSFDYIIDDGLVLDDTIEFDVFSRQGSLAITQEHINNGYVIIDISFKSENGIGVITSEATGDQWYINNVGESNPYTINAITPVGNSTKIANIQYKANNITSLNDNINDLWNAIPTDYISTSDASTTVPSADATTGSYGSGTTYARSNHVHPKSSIYAEANHNHTGTYANATHSHTYTDMNNVSYVTATITYTDQTTQTVKLLKYDGS